MASNLSHGMKRVLAGILSLLVVAGSIGLPANVGGGLFAKNAIVAKAYSISDLTDLYSNAQTLYNELGNCEEKNALEGEIGYAGLVIGVYNYDPSTANLAEAIDMAYGGLYNAYNAARQALGQDTIGSGSSDTSGSGTSSEDDGTIILSESFEDVTPYTSSEENEQSHSQIRYDTMNTGTEYSLAEARVIEITKEDGITLYFGVDTYLGETKHEKGSSITITRIEKHGENITITASSTQEEITPSLTAGTISGSDGWTLTKDSSGSLTLGYSKETYLPEGWKVVSERTPDRAYQTWFTCNSAYSSMGGNNTAKTGDNFLYHSSGNLGSEYLVTPKLDLSGMESAKLSFYYQNSSMQDSYDSSIVHVDILSVFYRINEGEWQTVAIFRSEEGHDDWTLASVDLPAEALTENVEFGFYTANTYSGFGYRIDDVVISGIGSESSSSTSIPYLTATWNESTQKVVYTEATASTYTEVASDTTAWVDGATYVVNSSVTITDRITVTGTVNLILCDDAVLTAEKGITVTEGNTLNIYGQQQGTGTLTAAAYLSGGDPDAENGAAIGGLGSFMHGSACGTINIHGGTVIANKYSGSSSCKAAGIGGAGYNGNGGAITVYSGTVNAYGSFGGAGIGSGYSNANGGSFTMYGGTVTAVGGDYAGGISGGSGTTGTAVTAHIYGGTLIATGCGEDENFQPGDGIGFGPIFRNNPHDHGTLTAGAGVTLQGSSDNETWTTLESPFDTRYQYMKAEGPQAEIALTHTHTLTYEAGTGDAANTITATCGGAGTCDLTDNKVTLTLTAPTSLTYDGTAKAATISGYPETPPAGLAAEPTIVYYASTSAGSTTTSGSALSGAPTNAGNYVAQITWGGQTASVAFTIAKAAPAAANFNFTAPGSLNYDGTAKAATVGFNTNSDALSGIGNITVKYSGNGGNTWTETAPTNVGTYYVGITVAEGTNYSATTSVLYDNSWSFVISKGSAASGVTPPTLASDSTYLTYSKESKNLLYSTGSVPTGCTMKYAVTTTDSAPTDESAWGATAEATDAGTYYVWYKVDGGDNYEDIGAARVNETVTIAPKSVTITPTGTLTKVYGEADPTTFTYTTADLCVGDSLSGALTRVEGENAGRYDFVVSGLTNPNYTVSLAEGASQFTITAKPITVTANNATVTYGDAAPTYEYTVSENGLVGNDTLTNISYSCSYAQYSNVDSYAITPSQTANANPNYNITFNSGTLTVEQKEIGINWTNTSFTYDGELHIPTASATGTVNNDEIGITVIGGQTNASDTAYTATASALTGAKAGNYALPTANTQTFTISKVASGATVPQNNLSLTYDGTERGLITAGTNTNGTWQYKLGTDGTYGDSVPTATDADTYTVYYKFVGDGNHEDIDENSFTVTIAPKTVTITGLSASNKVYDGTTNATISGTAIVSGKVGTDDVSVSGGSAAFADANVGTGKTVTFTGYTLSGTKANNYTLSAQPSATANITQAALTVTAKPKTITYGDAPANDGVEYSGFVNNETSAVLSGTLGYTYTYSQYGDVGNTYTITPSGLTSGNYNISFVAGTLTVQAKTIGINWTNTTFTYNGESHIPTASATGTVNDDGIGITVIGGQTNASDTAYTATASALTGAKAGNYALPTANTQTFTISKANPTAVAPTGLTAIYGQTLADVTLTNPTGNTAGSWAWADTTTSVGDYGDRTFAANFTPTDATNYNNATNVQVTVTVGKAVPTYEAPVLQGTRLTHYSSDLLLIKTPGSVTEGQGTMYYAVTENDAAPQADAPDT